MFSLILYCGLISFVVSKHFNIKDGSEFDINTTLSTLASTTIPVSKDEKKCILEMKESEISKIRELYESNLVNLVDIHVLFSNSSHDKQLLSNFHVSLVYPTANYTQFVSTLPWIMRWSWTVGIRNVELNIKWDQKDCTKKGENVTDFARKITKHIVRKLNIVTIYQAHFYSEGDSLGKLNRTCCRTKKSYPLFATKSNHEEFISSFILFWISQLLFYILIYVYAFVFFGLPITPLSPSFIHHRIFWKEYGKMVSVIRRFVITSVWVHSFFQVLLDCWSCPPVLVFLVLFVCIPSVLFTFFPLFTTVLKRLDDCLTNIKNCLCQIILFAFMLVGLPMYFTFVIIIPWFAANCLVNGFLLNLNYFIPYFAFLFVFTFYWSNHSKSIEEKRPVAKRLIFEACKETEGITTISLQNNDVLAITPEQFFPCRTDHLYFGLKLCCSLVFSFGMFEFARMQNELNFVAQAVTTASLGVIPHIINKIASENSELERQKVWNEKFKLHVKQKLEEIILHNPGKTIAVIRKSEHMDPLEAFFDECS